MIKGLVATMKQQLNKNMIDPQWVYHAGEVIKGRWFEVEQSIMTDPQWAIIMLGRLLGGRWPEAEPIISYSPSISLNRPFVVGHRRH